MKKLVSSLLFFSIGAVSQVVHTGGAEVDELHVRGGSLIVPQRGQTIADPYLNLKGKWIKVQLHTHSNGTFTLNQGTNGVSVCGNNGGSCGHSVTCVKGGPDTTCTWTNHPFQTGDRFTVWACAGAGWSNLNNDGATNRSGTNITRVDANTFTIRADTSAASTPWSSSGCQILQRTFSATPPDPGSNQPGNATYGSFADEVTNAFGVQDLLAKYYQAGFTAVAITSHSTQTHVAQSLWPAQPPNFIELLPADEWVSFLNGQVGGAGSVGVHTPEAGCQSPNIFEPQSFFEFTASKHCYGAWAHPWDYDSPQTRNVSMRATRPEFIEVCTNSCSTGLGHYSGEQQVDNSLTDGHWPTWISAVDDFHQTFAGGPLGIGLGINYDYVNVDPLTTDVAADQAAILSALRAGRFIAVHGFDDPNTLPILTISGNTLTAASQGANIVCEWSGAAGTTAGWTGVIASQRLTQLLEPAQTNV
ncbi:MAG TPA: hypothetical protein VGF59_31395, partial [Bryobacteraceae bacterium]